MFDIGIGEFLIIAVIALLVFGPDRLPKATAQAAALIRQLREQAAAARDEITSAVDLDSTGLKDLAELHPRRIARSVLEPVKDARDDLLDVASDTGRRRPEQRPRSSGVAAGGAAAASDEPGDVDPPGTPASAAPDAPPAFDPDAT